MRLYILGAELKKARNALKEDRQALLKSDPSIETPADIRFHAGYRSLRLYRYAHAFYVAGFRNVSAFIHFISRVLYAVDIHPAAEIEPGVVIDHGMGVVIGSTAKVGSGTVIYHGVTLGAKNITTGKRHPQVGKNVFIGAGATLLGAINVGDGARIGAGSVVVEDVPPYSTVVGVPAKVVKQDCIKEVVA